MTEYFAGDEFGFGGSGDDEAVATETADCAGEAGKSTTRRGAGDDLEKSCSFSRCFDVAELMKGAHSSSSDKSNVE